MLKKPKGVNGRPDMIRVTVDFKREEFRDLEGLVTRSGASGKAEVIRFLARLYKVIEEQKDDIFEGQGGTVEEDEVYLAIVCGKKAYKVKEPEW